MAEELVPTAKVEGKLPPFQPRGDEPLPADVIVIPTYKLFTPGHATAATFFGGPLGGAAVLALNYKRLREPGKAWASIILGAIATAVLVALAYKFSAAIRGPWIAVPSLLAMSAIAKAVHGQAHERHVADGGKTASSWGVVGIAIASAALTLGGAFGVGYAYAYLHRPHYVTFDKNTVLYQDGGTEAEARDVGAALQRLGFFHVDLDGAAVVRRVDGRAEIELVTADFVFGDKATQTAIHRFASELSKAAFHGEPVDLILVDGMLQPRVQLHWEFRPRELDLGDGHVIVIREGGTEAEAHGIEKLLADQYFEAGHPATVAVERDGDRHVVVFTLTRGWDVEDQRLAYAGAAEDLSKAGFGGQPVDIWLNDESDVTRAKLTWEGRPQQVELAGGSSVVYREGGTEYQARAVATVLKRHGYFPDDHPAMAIVRRDGDRHVIAFVLGPSAIDSPAQKKQLYAMIEELSREAFGGAPVDLWMNDAAAETHAKLTWEARPH